MYVVTVVVVDGYTVVGLGAGVEVTVSVPPVGPGATDLDCAVVAVVWVDVMAVVDVVGVVDAVDGVGVVDVAGVVDVVDADVLDASSPVSETIE
ncbi:hypothetical protein H7J06_19590 [Mycobacterium hodleri]|uniref:hypothetical protein n=1 Tax=Mycolicibacterium hodleri TaxID=49897 RepID=UPI0021F2F0BC|nr:hypothetical protein [Mycolicibacterium hodleri]MCV7135188.1 hypothetical protein [Mycolicibacterium hodleri]